MVMVIVMVMAMLRVRLPQEEVAEVEGSYDEVPIRPSLPRQAKNKRD